MPIQDINIDTQVNLSYIYPIRKRVLINCLMPGIKQQGERMRGVIEPIIDGRVQVGTPYKRFMGECRTYLKSLIPIPILRGFMLRTSVRLFIEKPYALFTGLYQRLNKLKVEKAGIHACDTGFFGWVNNREIIRILDDRRNKNYKGENLFFGLVSIMDHDWVNDREPAISDFEQALNHPLTAGASFVQYAYPERLSLKNKGFWLEVLDIIDKTKPVLFLVTNWPEVKDFNATKESTKNAILESVDPKNFEWAFKQYPNIKFILGAFGIKKSNNTIEELYTEDIFNLAETYPNFYIGLHDLPFQPDYFAPSVLKRIRARNLISKIIYESNANRYPGYYEKFTDTIIQMMFDVGYTQSEVRGIMYNVLFMRQGL